jgi:hypothetical protein
MTHCSQPTTSSIQRYSPSYGPLWDGYDRHHGGYGGFQMYSPPQIPGQGPPSPGELTVHRGPRENHPLNCPTSSSSNPPPEHPSGEPRCPPIYRPTKRFQPPVEQRKTDVARIAELPLSREMSNDDYH